MLISHGVPQGSIPGPLLFLIFVNDFAFQFDNALPVVFEDDTNTVFPDQNFNSLIKQGSCILDQTARWFQMNKLSLNINKTNYMVFRHMNKIHSNDDLSLFKSNINFPRFILYLTTFIHTQPDKQIFLYYEVPGGPT